MLPDRPRLKKRAEQDKLAAYSTETFLKGTQSCNPHNDYAQHFVDTGERPQNFIRDTDMGSRFEEYPKLRELVRLKEALVEQTAAPPMYLRTDVANADLPATLQTQFEVILIEPPLETSQTDAGQAWSWDDVERLEVERLAAPRSFVWLWCGAGEGLDAARRCLRKWGFRRCEDICWIKTNRLRPGHQQLEPGAVLQRTKEHCLMGIRGTVRRSSDAHFIHANVDIDLLIEEPRDPAAYGARDKPVELFHLIEHFCLSKRRLHLFGRDSTLRPGWLTVGPELTSSNFNVELYRAQFPTEADVLIRSTEEVERLRPKSPPPASHGGASADSKLAPSATPVMAIAHAAGGEARSPLSLASIGRRQASFLQQRPHFQYKQQQPSPQQQQQQMPATTFAFNPFQHVQQPSLASSSQQRQNQVSALQMSVAFNIMLQNMRRHV